MSHAQDNRFHSSDISSSGDYTVSIPSTFVATNDLDGARNGLDSLYQLQNASGAMPYAGGMLTFDNQHCDTYTNHLQYPSTRNFRPFSVQASGLLLITAMV